MIKTKVKGLQPHIAVNHLYLTSKHRPKHQLPPVSKEKGREEGKTPTSYSFSVQYNNIRTDSVI